MNFKNVKRVFLFVCIITATISCTSEEPDQVITETNQVINVENVNTTQFEIVQNGSKEVLGKNELKKMWENRLNMEGNFVELGDFEIQQGDIDKDGNNEMILVSKSIDGTTKIGASIIRTNKENGRFLLSGTTVSCTGCIEGCNPKKVDGEWICTKCDPSAGVVCTKTVTIEEGGGLDVGIFGN